MKFIRDLPIQRKMLGMTLLICGAVLCVAVLALFTFQMLNFRAGFRRDTVTLAEVIANNSTAAVEFADEQHATEIITAARAKPSVLSASLVMPNGTVLAHFGAGETAASLKSFPSIGSSEFMRGQLLVTQPVQLKGERAAVLYLRSDFRTSFLELVRFYAQIVLGVMLVSTILALLLSRWLGRSITNPVLRLAGTAQVVGDKKDYSVRAEVGSGDELGRLAEAFNEMLSRIQSQDAALSRSQQHMQALIHSIDGIVWERKPETFQYTFVSRQSQAILGFAPEAWLEKPSFWEERLHPQDAAKALKAVKEGSSAPDHYTTEYRMVAADGRTVWIRESATILVEQGRPAAVRGIYQDVTQQRLQAEELDKLNRQLIGTSRLAGMAEVATGVLHNVGNVLNSVSVQATAVNDRLKKLKVDNLRRAAGLLREQNGNLAQFLTDDPKGKVVPGYLVTMSEQLASEQGRLIAKMDLVSQHIEHIKEIVAMQQSYAKISGVYENLPPVDLVEDALRMNAAAFDRHGIELIREFDPGLPNVFADRHKVLQILINLLRNAKYAMDLQTGRARLLKVRVASGGPDRIRITVADNGVGISPENLTRIFNHGFTTKREGHGFGLHSGANAAKEMGGTLTASSEGLGKGAEFTLELPTASPTRQATEQETTQWKAQPDTLTIAS